VRKSKSVPFTSGKSPYKGAKWSLNYVRAEVQTYLLRTMSPYLAHSAADVSGKVSAELSLLAKKFAQKFKK